MRKVLFVAIILLFGGMARSDDFVNFTFIDCYEVLRNIDDSTIDPTSYYGQLKSLGIDVTFSVADSLSTNNTDSIKIIGHDFNIKVNIGGSEKDVMHLAHTAINIHAEVENTDSDEGYYWSRSEGNNYYENDELIGLLYDPYSHSANTVLSANGVKFCSRNGYSPIVPRYRMKRFYDSADSDTLCRIRFINNNYDSVYYLTGADFQGERDDWVTIVGDTFPTGNYWARIYMNVYWYGNDSLAIDRIDLIGVSSGENLEFQVDANDIDTAFIDYFQRINTDNHEQLRIGDEPKASQFWAFNLLDDHASSVPPYHRSTTVTYHDIPLFVRDINPSQIIANYYPIKHYYDSSSSSTPDSCAIQVAYDDYVAVLRSYADSAIGVGNKPLWVLTQAGGQRWLKHWDLPSCDTNLVPLHRNPTYNEQQTLVYLPLLYGATGVGYYLYATLYFADSVYLPPDLDIRIPKDMSAAEQEPEEGCEPIYVGGLVEWDPLLRRYVPTYRWNAAKAAHDFIDSLWITLEDLEWEDANDWLNIGNLENSIIDSIYSTTFSADSTYIECGTFSSVADEYYHMFVNRRTLSSDSQEVTLEIENFFGTMEFYDVYTGLADTVFDSSGFMSYDLSFQPAECKLLRIKELKWHGTLSNDMTWPNHSTIKMDGDIIVYLNKDLEIGHGVTIKPEYRDDQTSGGYDNDMTELRVWGDLRIEGTSSNKVNFSAPGDSTGWYGIVCEGTGKVYLENVEIKHAKYGVFGFQSANGDSIIDCVIDSCDLYGIYAYTDDDLYVNRCQIGYIEDGYGIYLSASDSVGLYANTITSSNGLKASYSSADCIGLTLITDSVRSNTVGIDAYGNNTLDMTTVTIEDYQTGIKVGSSNTIEIQSSAIFENDTTASNRVLYGVDASAATSGSCEIRGTCFGSMDLYHVYSNGSIVDLGTSFNDPGDNDFYADTIKVKDCEHIDPDYYIYNSNTQNDTLEAKYNYFSCPDAPIASYIYGDVDYSTNDDPQAWCYGYHSKASRDFAIDEGWVIPKEFSVGQNYPNPFNPLTTIEYSLPEASKVDIAVYNILGQEVKSLVNRNQSAGEHTVTWDGKDNSGHPVATGVYFYRITAGSFIESKKMVILK